ncbi:uncharacterized protein [Nicotiana tomentosiformis]|uniref:uncharacterized protein n=1 Tax=Nicotiana tomentosiformis TaxID=4098 RepID=UPI00388C93EB
MFLSQFDVQGRCNIGLLEYRHLLVRFDLYNDYVQLLSRSTGYVKAKGNEFFFRTFPWTLGFNPKEETSMAVVWISFPGLPPNIFAKRSLLSIASAMGKALAVDMETQERTRPSATRVRVILDLLDKHLKKVKLLIVDRILGKTIMHYQEVVYDNLPTYCTYCKHPGHDENVCRVMKEQAGKEVRAEEVTVGSNLPVVEVTNSDKLQGDARDYLNAKRMNQIAMEIAGGKLVDEATKKVLVEQQVLQNEGGKQIVNLNNEKVMSREANGISVCETSTIDKGPSKPTRDVPATTALSRIFNVVNPVVQAFDKTKDRVASGLSTDAGLPSYALLNKEDLAGPGVSSSTQAAGALNTNGKSKVQGIVTTTTALNRDAARVNAMEKHGHLQQMMDASALAAAVQNNAKVAGAQVDTSANVESSLQAARIDVVVTIGSDVAGVGQTSNDQRKSEDQQVTKVASKANDANREGQESGKRDVVTGDCGTAEGSNLEDADALKTNGDRATAGVVQPTAAHADLIEKSSAGQLLGIFHRIIVSNHTRWHAEMFFHLDPLP